MSATPGSNELADLNPIAVTELVERAGEGPVVMLNLLDFKPAGGFERYAEYSEAVAPLLEKVGARVVFAGNANVPVIGPSKWDLVLLVEYPTRQAFLDMTSSPEYVAIARLRSEALERSELHPLDPRAPRLMSASPTREELRELQGPIKSRYREQPASAQITLRADGSLEQGISCSVQTGQALVEAGLHPGTGGDGSLACSGDMLLQSLIACAGVTMRSVATSMGIAVTGAIHAEGDLDWRGTLAVDKEVPAGFKEIRLRFEIESDAGDEELATLQRLTERYCVVLQTLTRSPALSSSLDRA